MSSDTTIERATHTLPPWSIFHEPNGDISIESTYGSVARVLSENCDDPAQILADGLLIASAPELLAACELAVEMIADCQRLGCPAGPVAVPSLIRDAIAKARG